MWLTVSVDRCWYNSISGYSVLCVAPLVAATRLMKITGQRVWHQLWPVTTALLILGSYWFRHVTWLKYCTPIGCVWPGDTDTGLSLANTGLSWALYAAGVILRPAALYRTGFWLADGYHVRPLIGPGWWGNICNIRDSSLQWQGALCWHPFY